MKCYVLDANALIRYFRRTPGSVVVLELFEKAKTGQIRVLISVVNLTEVLYVTAKYYQLDKATAFVNAARTVIETMPVDDRVAMDTGAVRVRYKMSLGDCFAAELAMRLGATLVTADPEFAKIGKQLKVLALPPHKS